MLSPLEGTTLRQTQLLPSGCQVWNRNVLAASPSGNLIAYASTLAIFVFDVSRKPVALKRMLTGHAKMICCIAWSPVEEDLIVSGSADGSLSLWTLSPHASDARLATLTLPYPAFYMSWEKPQPNSIAIANTVGTVLMWDLASESRASGAAHSDGEVRECYTRKHRVPSGKNDAAGERDVAACVAWNPKQAGSLLCGHLDGSWVLWDDGVKKLWCKPQFTSTKAALNSRIVTMAWDPLGGNCALAAYSSGVTILWDIEAQTELLAFERQPLGVHALCWLDFAPGAFATVNDTTSVAKVWNVSQQQAQEHVRVAGVGVKTGNTEQLWGEIPNQSDSECIFSLLPMPGGRMLLAFLDGSVGVWNWRSRTLSWRSSAAHTETIFDVTFSPADPDVVATASYDGMLALWFVPTMTLLKIFHTDESALLHGPKVTKNRWFLPSALNSSDFGCTLYSVEWSPDGTEIAASCVSGNVYLFDVKSGKTKQNLPMHKPRTCYKTVYYCGDGGAGRLLASVGGDSTAAVFDRDGTIQARYNLPGGCFGCDWSAPLLDDNVALLCVGCFNGCAYIYGFDLDITKQKSSSPLLRLSGHTERIFNVAFSPLVKGLVATGSDDGTIRVWALSEILAESKAKANCTIVVPAATSTVLRGHLSKVRPISWNHEIPSLLLSGSWDSSIKVWDVSVGQLVSSGEGHLADVYGLTSHPKRPFVFASCSRDNSLRFWNLQGPQISLLRLRATVDLELPSSLVTTAPTDSSLLFQSKKSQQGAAVSEGKTGEASTNEEMGKARPIVFCGDASSKLRALFAASSGGIRASTSGAAVSDAGAQSLEAHHSCLQFFGRNTSNSLWSLAADSLHLKARIPIPQIQRVVLVDNLVGMKREQVLLLESHRLGMSRRKKAGGFGEGLKKDEALALAAEISFKCGDFSSSCRLLLEIGSWELALALAPAVSVGYWRDLLRQHAQFQGSEHAGGGTGAAAAAGRTLQAGSQPALASTDIALHLAGDDPVEGLKLLLARDDLSDALLVAAALKEGRFGKDERSGGEGKNSDSDWRSEVVSGVSARVARQYLSSAQPDAAASVMLSCRHFSGAVASLVRGNELEAAYGLATAWKASMVQSSDGSVPATVVIRELLPLLANKAAALGDRRLSHRLMSLADERNSVSEGGKGAADASLQAALLASDPACSTEDMEYLLGSAGLPSSQGPARARLEQEAQHADEQGDAPTAARKWLLALGHRAAADVLLRRDGLLERLALRRSHSSSSGSGASRDGPLNQSLREALCQASILTNAVEARHLHDDSCGTLVAWSFFLGAWSAQEAPHPILGLDLQCMAGHLYAACVKHAPAGSLLRDMAESALKVSAEDPESLTVDDDVDVRRIPSTVTGPIVPVDSLLPELRMQPPPDGFPIDDISVLDQSRVEGPVHVLEDGTSVMPLADALMWRILTPFSPLCTGERLTVV